MRYKRTSENPEKNGQTDKAIKSQTQRIKVKTVGPIVFVFYYLFSIFGGPMYVKILKKQGVKINTRVCGPCYLARFVKKVTT